MGVNTLNINAQMFQSSRIFPQLDANVGHMSSGGLRSKSLSTEAETAMELLPLATHNSRHYLYAVLAATHFISSCSGKYSNEANQLIPYATYCPATNLGTVSPMGYTITRRQQPTPGKIFIFQRLCGCPIVN